MFSAGDLSICVCMCVCIVRPMHVQLHEGQHMCAVCNDVANGIHFGALTCEGCKVRLSDSESLVHLRARV